MRRALLLTILGLAFAAPAFAADKPAVPVPRLVARIDTLMATQKGPSVTIQAKGAVSSGGWRNARLRVVRIAGGDPHVLAVEFVATPPSPGHAEIAGLLPINASAVLRAPKGVVSVRALSAYNEITSQILK